MYSLNKLESYSRISALGPVGHCTSHFKRAMCISCRPCVDVHKGGGGAAHVDACGQGEGGQKRDFFVDVINGWPHTRSIVKVIAHLEGNWAQNNVECITQNPQKSTYDSFCNGGSHIKNPQ